MSKRTYTIVFEVEGDDLPTPVAFMMGIHDGLPETWFDTDDGDSFFIERMSIGG